MTSIAQAIRAFVLGAASVLIAAHGAAAQNFGTPADPAWSVPEVGALPNDENGQMVRRGRDLLTATYAHIGPAVADPAKRYAGNNLACSNCHLMAGTKKFGLPLWGLWNDFPQYSTRAGAEISIEDRINSCMTRSMNGKPLPAGCAGNEGDRVLHQIPVHRREAGRDLVRARRRENAGARSAPPIRCAARKSMRAPARHATRRMDWACFAIVRCRHLGYLTPPLWGPDSFNDGAGMARLTNAANFIHFNMPNGTSYNDPRLSQADAWDVAAYVISRPRPSRAGIDKDFPDLLQKPVDTPYGPYADKFSQTQHQFGPFAPIKAAIDRLKAQKKK